MIAIIGLVVLVAAVAVGMVGVLSTGTPGSRSVSLQPAEAANSHTTGDAGTGEDPVGSSGPPAATKAGASAAEQEQS
jgi:hypothetical protein